MLKEAPVFNCEYGVDQHFGNLAITQYFAFSSFRGKIGRQDLRFERERIEQTVVVSNFGDLVSHKRNPHDLFRSRRPDLDCCVSNAKTSTPNLARVDFEIPRTTQRSNKLFARQLLAALNNARSGVQPGPAGQITIGKSRIDDL